MKNLKIFRILNLVLGAAFLFMGFNIIISGGTVSSLIGGTMAFIIAVDSVKEFLMMQYIDKLKEGGNDQP